MEILPKFGDEHPRGVGRHLVLDGDVESRRSLVLRAQKTVKMIGNVGTRRQQLAADDTEGRAAAQRINFAHFGQRRGRVGGYRPHQIFEFLERGRRQLVKKGDVRRDVVAQRRVMRRTKRVEMALVCRAHRRGKDDGRGTGGPGGRGEGPGHQGRDGMDEAVKGGLPSSMGRPVSLPCALAEAGNAIQSINWVTMIGLSDDLAKTDV